MATATHTQFGSRTRLTVTGSVTNYATGTRLAVDTVGEKILVDVKRFKVARTAGTAASFTPRLYSTSGGQSSTISQQFVGSSTVIADLFDVACTGVVFDTDASGKIYVEFGPNAGADNAFDYELVLEVL